GLHHGGRAALTAIDWSGLRTPGSYSDSKLFVTTLAMAVARIWPEVFSNAVDPGWVPTKMGGAGASDDLRLGHLTQEGLAARDQRRPGGPHLRRVLVPPAPHRARAERRRPTVPGRTARRAGSLHRRAFRMTHTRAAETFCDEHHLFDVTLDSSWRALRGR